MEIPDRYPTHNERPRPPHNERPRPPPNERPQPRNRDSHQGPNAPHRPRRDATNFSATQRSNVQSSRGRPRQHRKPDFLILHSENTTFLKNMKNAETKLDPKDTAEEEVEEDSTEIKCPFCTLSTPRISGVKLQAITSCSHVMCFECALRWHFLSSQATCPMCRQELTKIIITARLDKEHSNVQQLMYEYTHNSKLLTPLNAKVDGSPSDQENQNPEFETSLVFIDGAKGKLPLPKGIREIIHSVMNFECKICVKRNFKDVFTCGVRFKTNEILARINEHLSSQHKSTLCELCFINLDGFASEYQIFGQNELQLHRKYGTKTPDKSALVGPHPCCHLCEPNPTYYYNMDALELHCKTIHCSCYVCSQAIFFRNSVALRKHVEENHLLCTLCAESTNQILGFSTVNEYRRHIDTEHPNAELDMDSLSARVRVEFDPFANDDGEDGDERMTDRMANDQIDNLLRQSFQSNRHQVFDSSNVENYVTNFPSIAGMVNGERLLPTTQNVHVFPGRRDYGRMGGRNAYEQDFPTMGPSSVPGPSTGPSMASVSGLNSQPGTTFNLSMYGKMKKSKARKIDLNGRKVEPSNRPLNNVGIPGLESQPAVSWKGKKPKNEEFPSIFDDFVETKIPGDSEPSVSSYKPPTVVMIERQESASNPTQQPQRAPKKEDFPSLGPSSSSGSTLAKLSSANNKQNSGSGKKSKANAGNARKIEFGDKKASEPVPRPLNEVGISGTKDSQPAATWKGKKPRAGTEEVVKPASIFDDFIETKDPVNAESTTMSYKPPTVQLIERQEPLPSATQRPQRAPKKDDFPSLAAPKPSNRNNGSSTLSGWSKITKAPVAPEPEAKDAGKKKKNGEKRIQDPEEVAKKLERVNLSDSSAFPDLSTPSSSTSVLSGKSNAWGIDKPVKTFKRTGKLNQK